MARRTPTLLTSVQQLLMEVHLTPRYGLRNAAQYNLVMGHLVDAHGLRIFTKPRRNRGFPWARNQTLPALVREGVDPVACCAELHLSRQNHTAAFFSHAAWLAQQEPEYVAAQQADARRFAEGKAAQEAEQGAADSSVRGQGTDASAASNE